MKKHVVIIAEAGVNHNGSIDLAKKLIDAAAAAGADYVKFQTFKTENLVDKKAVKADYQIQNTQSEGSQFDMLKKLELSEADHHILKAYCGEKSIHFLSTAFDLESFDLLKKMDLGLYKIPSGEITNLPLLEEIGKSGKDIVVSTGMATLEEVEATLKVLFSAGANREKITLLHCNSDYPTKMDDVNLLSMLQLGQKFGTAIGYSDHTLGIEVPIAAVALGAVCIEKHFTLDKSLPGPDHLASLDPQELKEMVTAIRNIEAALGSGIKAPTVAELKNKSLARKSIYAKSEIKKGEIFTAQNLTTKRPDTGISAMQWHNVLGKAASRNFAAGEKIEMA
jgi:N,N'-diacetyllegionaminate synthase